MKQIIVVDLHANTATSEVERLLNKTCEQGYSLHTIVPGENGSARAYFHQRSTDAWKARDSKAMQQMTAAVRAAFGQDDPVTYRDGLGSEATFYRWRKWAIKTSILVWRDGKLYMPEVATVPR